MLPSMALKPGKGRTGAQRYDGSHEYPVKIMADIKQAPYILAYNQRMKEIGESLQSPHKGAPPARDPELEMKPSRDAVQLGEGSKK